MENLLTLTAAIDVGAGLGLVALPQRVCDSVGDPLRMDLSNLAGTDAAGLAVLQSRIAAGAQVVGASPYIRLLLDSAPVLPRTRKSKGDDS